MLAMLCRGCSEALFTAYRHEAHSAYQWTSWELLYSHCLLSKQWMAITRSREGDNAMKRDISQRKFGSIWPQYSSVPFQSLSQGGETFALELALVFDRIDRSDCFHLNIYATSTSHLYIYFTTFKHIQALLVLLLSSKCNECHGCNVLGRVVKVGEDNCNMPV